MKCLAFVLFILSFSAWANPIDDKGWLAFGELRGYVEPCGCDPSADLGGIQRHGLFLERERSVSPGLWLFNLGNNPSVKWREEAYKTPILLKAIAQLKPDAILFNELESQVYPEHKKLFKSAPYVRFAEDNPAGIKKMIRKKGVTITGIVGEVTPKELRALQSSMSNEKTKVLLFAGPEHSLQSLVAVRLFDLIISANGRALESVVGPEEKENESLLQRPSGNVRMVPVGGQGMLRGGLLMTKKAKGIKDLLRQATCESPLGCGDRDALFAASETITWLTGDYALPSPLDPLYAEYQAASKDRFSALVALRRKDLANSPFVGSESCKSCHPQAYEVYKASAHAQALKTLEKKGQAQNPECVTCHVLGFEQAGGFVSQKYSPQFAHVNCENCHGPRKEHVQKPSLKHSMADKAAEVCVGCHHGTHTPNFQYSEYWPRIEHGKEKS